MMDEAFISGYCRRLDQSTIVAVELEGKALRSVDCEYGKCAHEPNCPIAKQIRELLHVK